MKRLSVAWMLALAPWVPCAWADSGADLFREHCSPCHGTRGEGGRGANLAVRRLPRAPDDATLGAIIAQGIPGTEMPVTRMTDQERGELIAYVRSLGQAQSTQVAGDRGISDKSRGEQLFWSKGNCGQCHTVGSRGGRIGPDLTNIGERRGPANLRQSLLDPEAATPENFAQYRKVIFMPDNYLRVRVVTAEGKQITGARVDEDTFTIQIRDDAARIYSFRKDELKELHKDWGKSPMPSYRGVFSEAEREDVIAYLASLTGEP
jgi:cytochrome c oxidase cbb3-type subunit III